MEFSAQSLNSIQLSEKLFFVFQLNGREIYSSGKRLLRASCELDKEAIVDLRCSYIDEALERLYRAICAQLLERSFEIWGTVLEAAE